MKKIIVIGTKRSWHVQDYLAIMNQGAIDYKFIADIVGEEKRLLCDSFWSKLSYKFLSIYSIEFKFRVRKVLSLARVAKRVKDENKEESNIFWAISLWSAFIARFAGVENFVFTPMGSDILQISKTILGRLFIKYCLKNCSNINSDSEIVVDRLREIGIKTSATIIEIGINENLYRTEIPFSKKEKNSILWTRALTSLYNPEIFIKAVKMCEDESGEIFDIHVCSAFGSERIPELERLVTELKIKSNFNFYGRVPPEKLYQMHLASDIYISIPSSDASPRSVYEALLLGNKVVVSDLPWVKAKRIDDLVISVKTSNISELSNAILTARVSTPISIDKIRIGLYTFSREYSIKRTKNYFQELSDKIYNSKIH